MFSPIGTTDPAAPQENLLGATTLRRAERRWRQGQRQGEQGNNRKIYGCTSFVAATARATANPLALSKRQPPVGRQSRTSPASRRSSARRSTWERAQKSRQTASNCMAYSIDGLGHGKCPIEFRSYRTPLALDFMRDSKATLDSIGH